MTWRILPHKFSDFKIENSDVNRRPRPRGHRPAWAPGLPAVLGMLTAGHATGSRWARLPSGAHEGHAEGPRSHIYTRPRAMEIKRATREFPNTLVPLKRDNGDK